MTMRHYAKFRKEEIVILGYKSSMNHVMVCKVTTLPADDQAALRQIASSVYAQEKCDYLIPTLQSERHKSGSDWFTYLATRLHRNDGSVSTIPLKELEDMNPEQKAFFKGYGDSVSDAKKKIDESTESHGLGHSQFGEDFDHSGTAERMDGATEAILPPIVDTNAQMLALMTQMAASQAATTEALTTLAANSKPAPVKRAPRKKAASKA